MIELTRRYGFPAAHILSQSSFSAEKNRAIYGKCANPNGHGHNYGVEVTVTGPVDGASGQIIPLERLDALFDERVRGPFSHRMLNELSPFAGRVPTAENIAVVIHEQLAEGVSCCGDAHLARVRVVETARNSFEYGDLD